MASDPLSVYYALLRMTLQGFQGEGLTEAEIFKVVKAALHQRGTWPTILNEMQARRANAASDTIEGA